MPETRVLGDFREIISLNRLGGIPCDMALYLMESLLRIKDPRGWKSGHRTGRRCYRSEDGILRADFRDGKRVY